MVLWRTTASLPCWRVLTVVKYANYTRYLPFELLYPHVPTLLPASAQTCRFLEWLVLLPKSAVSSNVWLVALAGRCTW